MRVRVVGRWIALGFVEGSFACERMQEGSKLETEIGSEWARRKTDGHTGHLGMEGAGRVT